MIFQREPIATLWPEVWPLLQAHYREVAHFQDVPLEIDRAFYEKSEAAGSFRAYTARGDMTRTLVGYAAYFVLQNPHYLSFKQAVMDVVYITPECRGLLAGMRLINWCNEQLLSEGSEASFMHIKAKPGLDFGRMLERMGYEWVEKIYVKRLQVISRENAA